MTFRPPEAKKGLMSAQFWLMKSEPDTFSIDDLKRDKTTKWEGVRNYQARNYMLNDMKVGDQVLFYHSNATPAGIVGLAEVSATAAPDALQFDAKSEYFDPKSTKANPRWHCVQVRYVAKFAKMVTLDILKNEPALQEMFVVRKGSRLSITPVTKSEFDFICKLAK